MKSKKQKKKTYEGILEDMMPHELLWHNIKTLCDLYGVSEKEQQVIMRMSKSTYDRRKAKPQNFTVEEIEAIAKRLELTVNELFLERKFVA